MQNVYYYRESSFFLYSISVHIIIFYAAAVPVRVHVAAT